MYRLNTQRNTGQLDTGETNESRACEKALTGGYGQLGENTGSWKYIMAQTGSGLASVKGLIRNRSVHRSSATRAEVSNTAGKKLVKNKMV